MPSRSHAVGRSLASSPTDELAAGAIAARFDVTRPAVSQHLAVLRAAGLVTERRDGTRRLVPGRPAGLEPLRDWLGRFWDDSLERLRVAAEAEMEGDR